VIVVTELVAANEGLAKTAFMPGRNASCGTMKFFVADRDWTDRLLIRSGLSPADAPNLAAGGS